MTRTHFLNLHYPLWTIGRTRSYITTWNSTYRCHFGSSFPSLPNEREVPILLLNWPFSSYGPLVCCLYQSLHPLCAMRPPRPPGFGGSRAVLLGAGIIWLPLGSHLLFTLSAGFGWLPVRPVLGPFQSRPVKRLPFFWVILVQQFV